MTTFDMREAEARIARVLAEWHARFEESVRACAEALDGVVPKDDDPLFTLDSVTEGHRLAARSAAIESVLAPFEGSEGAEIVADAVTSTVAIARAVWPLCRDASDTNRMRVDVYTAFQIDLLQALHGEVPVSREPML